MPLQSNALFVRFVRFAKKKIKHAGLVISFKELMFVNKLINIPVFFSHYSTGVLRPVLPRSHRQRLPQHWPSSRP